MKCRLPLENHGRWRFLPRIGTTTIARVCSFFLFATWLETRSTYAAVHVNVVDTNGVAWIEYRCDAGEVVRAFALDVSVDRGEIIGVSNFFSGVSTSVAQGYGIFPASFRDHVTVTSGTNANWSAPGYSPVAVPADAPAGTLPGLGSSGVTLEFGA